MMSLSRRVVFVALVSVLGVLAGCEDQQAQQDAAAREALAQALKLVDQAEQGYIPTAKPLTALPDIRAQRNLAAYRQQELAKAAAKLEALRHQGPAAQQAVVARLLANVHASAASHLTRQAMGEWAQIGPRGAALVTQMVALGRAQGRARLYGGDEAPRLAKLQEFQAKEAKDLEAAEADAKQLDTEIGGLNNQIAAFQAKRDEAQAQAAKLREEAFGKQGQAQLELYLKAIELQSAGNVADAEGEKLGTRVSVLKGQLAIVTRQAELLKAANGIVTAEIAHTTASQDTIAGIKKKALSGDEAEQAGAGTVAKAAAAAFDQLVKDYDENVDKPFQAAVKEADAAVKAAQEGVTKAKDSGRGDLRAAGYAQMEQLAAEVTRLNVLAQRANANGAYGDTLVLLAGQAAELDKEHAAHYAETAKRVADTQDQVIAAGKAGGASATALQPMIPGTLNSDAQMGAVITQQGKLVSEYIQRLDAAKVKPLAAKAATPEAAP